MGILRKIDKKEYSLTIKEMKKIKKFERTWQILKTGKENPTHG